MRQRAAGDGANGSLHLKLVAKQIGHRPVVARPQVPAAVDERVHRAELLKQRRGVDDCHEVMEARHISETRSGGLVAEGECCG